MHQGAAAPPYSHGMSRSASAAATPLARAAASGRQGEGQMQQGVIPASYQSSISDRPAEPAATVYDPEYARVPMPAMYGMPYAPPVAAGGPPAPHAPGCACCTSSYGNYQPVYPAGAAAGCGPCASSGYAAGICAPGAAGCVGSYYDPQEYIYDGGDQPPVVRIRDDYTVAGLGPEDTVIQFTTEDGRQYAETGCRTAVYAPRFASLRRIQPLGVSDGVVGTRATLRDVPAVGFHAPLPAIAVAERTRIERDSRVEVIEAFRERNRGVPVVQNQAPRGWSSAFAPFEDLQLIRHGRWDATEGIAVQKGVAAALAWTNIDELAVLFDDQAASLIETTDHAEGLHVFEIGPARVRICKVASQQAADVGELVDFTIRYDNIGEQTLSALVIHDSLPPRLEYVEGSQQSSAAAEFEAVPNEVGSQTIRWRLTAPLEPAEGGVVRFQARVR